MAHCCRRESREIGMAVVTLGGRRDMTTRLRQTLVRGSVVTIGGTGVTANHRGWRQFRVIHSRCRPA